MTQNSPPTRKTSPDQSTAEPSNAGPVEPEADRVLDITGETCPMTFVRTRLALDRLEPGQLLLVLLRGDEPRMRVPATARALGHTVVGQRDQPDGTMRLLLRRAI